MRIIAVLCALALVASAFAYEPHRVTQLPGLPTSYKAGVFAGLIDVDRTAGRSLFYMFTEAQSNPSTAPLVLWLNGGPGCSSMEGLFAENGAFWTAAAGRLVLNENAWNKAANMLYLESPSGVGFSTSKTKTDYIVGDKRTADDTYVFLQEFLNLYPQYRNSDFWITGESYAGHYIPNAALRILEGNANATTALQIRLKGFMAGNPWTDAALDNRGAVDFWFSHAMISNASYAGIVNNCDFNVVGPLRATETASQCDTYTDAGMAEFGNINIYDIYQDVCQSSSVSATRLAHALAESGTVHRALPEAARRMRAGGDSTNEPAPACIDDYMAEYLNRADVQTALHVPPTKWVGCSNIVRYSRTDLLSSMIPVYRKLLSTGIRMLVYSGDVDAIVPFTGTRAWVESLNLPTVEKFRPWTVNGQVGGYVVVYKGLTFSTVRDAGHMVPGTQPQRALAMFTKFLRNEKF